MVKYCKNQLVTVLKTKMDGLRKSSTYFINIKMKHWVQHPIRPCFWTKNYGYGNVHFKLKSTKRFNLNPSVLFDYFLDKDFPTFRTITAKDFCFFKKCIFIITVNS